MNDNGELCPFRKFVGSLTAKRNNEPIISVFIAYCALFINCNY